MISRPYDIFRKDGSGEAVWVEAVENVERAKLRIIDLAARMPGQYLIFSQQTGQVVSTMSTAASPVVHDQHRIHDGSSLGQSDTLF